MSKSPKEKRDIGKIIAVVIWPSIFVIALCSTVFRNLFENFSILGLIGLIAVLALIIVPLIGAFGLFSGKKSDDK